MKKYIVTILMLVIVLTACTAAGSETETTAVSPTEVSLEPAPTMTNEPTAEPTATDKPTATAVPTATEEPQAYPAPEEAPTDEAPSGYQGTLPDDFEFPDGSAIVFTQTGGFAGFDDTWLFYPDGRVTLNEVEQAQLTPERIDRLINDLDDLGFFETEHITKPGEFCCDFFNYTLAVQSDDNRNYVSFSEGNPALPANLWDILELMREIMDEAQLR